MTYSDAVGEVLAFGESEDEPASMRPEEWRQFAARTSHYAAREKARELGTDSALGPRAGEKPQKATTRSAAAYRMRSPSRSPLGSLRRHPLDGDQDRGSRRRPEVRRRDPRRVPRSDAGVQPLAVVQLGTTGMTDEEMKAFPEELGKMGFVFNFITYGGHQIDGVAAEEFATSLQQDGMLALARLQRKMRLVESPYRTPQTLVGGPRSDAALAASSGRTATTKAMGKGSTQHQHLVQTEVPKKLLEEWLALWSEHYQLGEKLRVKLRPRRAGSDVLELGIVGDDDEQLANVIVDPIKDRHGRSIFRCATRTPSPRSCGRSD